MAVRQPCVFQSEENIFPSSLLRIRQFVTTKKSSVFYSPCKRITLHVELRRYLLSHETPRLARLRKKPRQKIMLKYPKKLRLKTLAKHKLHVFLINNNGLLCLKVNKNYSELKSKFHLFMFADQIKREIDLKRLYGRNLDCDFDFSATRRSLFNESKG